MEACPTDQAIDFANKYKVIDQYTDPESGFSGTVFEDESGKLFMAMRGTEPFAFPPTDWSTNIADIGSDGIAIDQSIAMYNWYQRLDNTGGYSRRFNMFTTRKRAYLGIITNPACVGMQPCNC